MQQTTVTLFVAGVGIFGTSGGIVVSNLLTRSWQRTQWLMDQRKDEFRDLIKGLDDAMRAEFELDTTRYDLTAVERRDRARATSDFYQIIRTRLFTAEDVQAIGLEKGWGDVIEGYKRDRSNDLFEMRYEQLLKALVKAANTFP
jgi:hypothetical protein